MVAAEFTCRDKYSSPRGTGHVDGRPLRSGLAHDSRNERTDRDVGLPWNNREGTNHHVSSNGHPEFLLAGPLLSADRAGQATPIARPSFGFHSTILSGGRECGATAVTVIR